MIGKVPPECDLIKDTEIDAILEEIGGVLSHIRAEQRGRRDEPGLC
jgi:hypothetical protein